MDDFTPGKTITLSEFIRLEQKKHEATGRFTNILLTIALATKIVSRGINRAGLGAMLGLAGQTNVQGEEVQKLDVYADEVFGSVLSKCEEFFSLVSEEQEKVIAAEEGSPDSKYLIAFDPLDGSSNIDVNVSIGTIWGIYRKRSSRGDDQENPKQFFQAGSEQLAAGYTIYGSSTMFVFSTGDGVHGFTLDPSIGEFILTNRRIRVPDDGKMFSCNIGNSRKWAPEVCGYIDYLRKGGADGSNYSQRYVGSLVADFHRTMLKGGIFLYPADEKNPNGKLRHLYECAPMAFLAEQAGGRATTGTQPVLDLVPEDIHQRTPLIVGSPKMIDEFEQYVAKHAAS